MLHGYFYIVSLLQIMWFVRIRCLMNRNIIKSAFSLNNNPVYTCSNSPFSGRWWMDCTRPLSLLQDNVRDDITVVVVVTAVQSLTSHVCRVPYYTRTWYELCCQRFEAKEAYTLNDVGKTLCRQLDSFKTKIINILSLRHLKTFHATFYKSSTFTGFITKYLYLNHGLKKQRSLVNDIISSPLCACMYLYLIFPAYELSIQDN